MNRKSNEAFRNKKQVTKLLQDIWYDICILERDYGIEYEGYMTNILKFTIECIANKYEIDLGLDKTG
jgi:hypothetical protein